MAGTRPAMTVENAPNNSEPNGYWVPAFAGTTPRERGKAPNHLRHLDDHPQLRPLLVLGERVALLGRGKAALRRQRQLLERRELRRLVDPALVRVLGLELPGLGGNQ